MPAGLTSRPRPFRPALLLVLAASLAFAQDAGTVLQVKGDPGQVARYKTKVKVELSFQGQKVVLDIDQTERAKVAAVDEDGRVTLERKVESSKQSVDGQEMPSSEEDLSESTIVLFPDGTLASFKSDDDKETASLSLRLSQASAAVFTKEAVKPGSKWTHRYAGDDKLGTKPGASEFEYLADERAAGTDCAKIRLAYAESASGGLSSKATLWVEKSSGDVVKSEFAYDGVPFPGEGEPVLAKATGTMERTEGSLVAAEGVENAGEQEKPKTIDEVVKDYEKIAGQFTFYRKEEDGSMELLMEVPRALIGKDIMLQATAASGDSLALVAGDPVTDLLFQFQELRKDKLTIVVPNRLFRARSGLEIQRAIEKSFADSYLEQFDIKARQEDRDSVLVDVSRFFLGDISRIEERFEGGGPLAALMGGGGKRMMLDSEKSFISEVKSFPENAVVQAVFNFTASGSPSLEEMVSPVSADPRSTVVRVVYNLWAVPEAAGYTPRTFDPRVGYFTVSFIDFTRDRELSGTRQWINRWNLKKKDPSAKVSEPVKPIVFWLDNGIPKAYREAVRRSLLVWNEPLEEAGFKDAIRVEQMPDDAGFDPADMRYNVVRWVASPGSAYAVANFRVHPTTGEIINAGIVVDANILRAATGELEGEIKPLARQKSVRQCDCLEASVEHAAFGFAAASALAEPGTFDEEDYIRQFIEAFVIHEMGHILGLRHNFAASTQLSAAELGDRATVEKHSTAASTMDYIPTNIWALGKSGVPYYGPGLGAYDRWAIHYGYADFGDPGGRAEANALAAWASRCNEPGLAYQTDEAADGFDPYVTRFDLGSDPLAYWDKYLATAKRLMTTLGDRSPRPGKSYYEFTRDYQGLLRIMRRSAGQMARFVGGLRLSGNSKGDPGERPPLAPIPGPVQRAALDKILRGVVAASSLNIPKSYLTRFAPNPDAGMIEAFLAGQNPHNALDDIAAVPVSAVSALMAPDRLARVVNNEFKTAAADRFTLKELFDGLDAAVWSELESGQEIDPVRRAVQRKHVEILTGMVTAPPAGLPDDARMLAFRSLKQLGTRVASAARTAPGPYGKPHLEDVLTRIARALNAVQTVGGASRGTPSLLDLLGGG